jgi:ribosomal protein S18 acetylase RimI-like enzyme
MTCTDVVLGTHTVGLTHSLFLKELYVSQTHRRAGVVEALMQRLTEIARDQRYSRVEWMTDQPNRNAQAFYASLGFQVDNGKVFYRVTLQ